MRRFLPALATAAFALLLVAGPYAFAQSAQTVVVMQQGVYYDASNCVGVQMAGGLYLCSAPPTPIATDTPTPTATATATLIPPTATVIVIAPTAANVSSINGVPLCGVPQPNGQVFGPAHDSTKWHPLTEQDVSGNVMCTYGHEHGMDPSQLDAVLGPLPLTQQISYPWATVSATGVPENGTYNKHSFYKWIEAPALQCSTNNQVDGSAKLVTAFREELHADSSAGAATRFHSFWGQYQLTDCATGSQGTLNIGGHMDYAQLHLANASIDPLPVDPAPGTCNLNGDSRQEGQLGASIQSQSVWYGDNSHSTLSSSTTPCDDATVGPHVSVGLNVTRNNFGPTDPANPGTIQYYPNLAQHDGVGIRTDALTIWISGFPTDATGHVTFTGHVNRHGQVVPEVPGQAEGQDYIPLLISNAEPKAYGANGALPCVGNLQRCPVVWSGDVAGPNGQLGWYVVLPW